jgi:Family of unknown function (DUF6335)
MPKRTRSVDANEIARPTVVPDEEVQLEFDEAARLPAGARGMRRKLSARLGPALTAGDLDTAWDRGDVSEEAVGGTVSTPDQDIVEEIGKAAGLTYEDNEPLRPTGKLEERDRKRWELNPASSEDFQERSLSEAPPIVAEQQTGSRGSIRARLRLPSKNSRESAPDFAFFTDDRKPDREGRCLYGESCFIDSTCSR